MQESSSRVFEVKLILCPPVCFSLPVLLLADSVQVRGEAGSLVLGEVLPGLHEAEAQALGKKLLSIPSDQSHISNSHESPCSKVAEVGVGVVQEGVILPIVGLDWAPFPGAAVAPLVLVLLVPKGVLA